ncbi:hypothetical protein [Actinophytocola gossypii]|uniref:MarR family transcriptional regulator n=1 Tax=Actinophytocola gossypii TaxID=2812003 RepID=A0ABT2JGL5_9PSEU|nr:hypothetical protein [Actinophytocola gossypii]MCT2587010.1 hypothetical protein [Actinophytocola gossypii]
MPEKKLTVKQRAVLITLMAEARALSNTEMKELHGLVLDGEERRDLVRRKYVLSERSAGNKPYVNELTDDGWRWCAEELSAGRPRTAREESLGKALYAVLAGLRRLLDHSKQELADLFPIETSASLEDRVRATYHQLAKEAGDYVRLVDLRRGLDGTPRDEVDAVLRKLNDTGQVVLVSEDSQGSLSEEERNAALRVGNQDNHHLAIEP